MRKPRIFTAKAVLVTLLSTIFGCSEKPFHTDIGTAEGTTYRIIYQYDRSLHAAIDTLLDGFENEFSIYREGSAISRFNHGEKMRATDRMKECIEISRKIHIESEGLFDPTLRPLIGMWGFGEDKRLKQPRQTEIDSVMQFVGFSMIGIDADTVRRDDPRVTLDFNAIAKGYSVDLVGKMFDSLGIENYLVEIGGEITTRGINASGRPWRIGIDRPVEGNFAPGADMITRIELDGHKGLATSGNYRKYIIDSTIGKVTHTIDPRTGRSVTHNLLSATIIAENTAIADGYATSCMVAGVEWSKRFITEKKLRAILIYSEDGEMVTWDSNDEKRDSGL